MICCGSLTETTNSGSLINQPRTSRDERRLCGESCGPRLQYLHLATRGLPHARNEGLRRVKGKIILFVDDDVILLSADFLTAHVEAYNDLKLESNRETC